MRPVWNPAERSGAAFRTLTVVASSLLLLFLALPFLAVLLRASPAEVLRHLAHPGVRDALRLSLLAGLSATSAIVLLGRGNQIVGSIHSRSTIRGQPSTCRYRSKGAAA